MLSTNELISVCLKFQEQGKGNEKGKNNSGKLCQEKKTIMDKMDQIIDETTSMAGFLIRVVFSENDEAFAEGFGFPF
jgi:hypothetical protein